MSQEMNLKELERKAWRSFHQDGLWDMLFGLILLTVYGGGTLGEPQRFAAWALLLSLGPLFTLAKKRITVPRMGFVEFGPARRSRRRKLTAVLTLAVFVTVALLLATIGGASWISDQHVLVSFGLGFGVFLSLGAMAYWMDLDRLYVIGLVFGAAITATELLDNPTPLLVAGVLVLFSGLVLLTRFLRAYPLPVEDHHNGGR